MTDPHVERDPVEVLAEEFSERLRQGERPSVADYVAEHPELADDIRDLFPAIAVMEQAKPGRDELARVQAASGPEQPDRLGDFRIIQEIGRGGMGIVYQAEQESLKRLVAVKLLPRLSLLAPVHAERFEREAQTAARLHHGNIVPVFGTGEQDGYHYIVMQLIRGVGLDEVITHLWRVKHQRPDSTARSHADDWPGLMDRVESLIEAKFASRPTPEVPGNRPPNDTGNRPALAETPRDATATEPLGRSDRSRTETSPALPAKTPVSRGEPRPGRAHFQSAARMIEQAADALHHAHRQGTLHRDIKPANLLLDAGGNVWIADFGLAKAPEDRKLSRSGQVSGTLQYMAPERFDGKTDERSDVYSLGLTLYELLLLRPAFDAANQSKLLWQVTHVPPPPPGRLSPTIPRDLETIVLKAIALDPTDRYQTAGELAADLGRFREDLPIRARRVGPVERFWRWGRRNPVVAGLTSAVALLLFVVAVVASAAYLQADKANDQVRRALAGEQRHRERAEATSELALEVLDEIYAKFAPSTFGDISPLATEGVDGDLIEVPRQPVLSEHTAALLENLLDFYDRLAQQGVAADSLKQETAKANRRVGSIVQHLGQTDRAIEAYDRALDIYRELQLKTSDQTSYRTEIAQIQNALGTVYQAVEEVDKASQAHRAAQEILEAQLAESPAEEIRYELARTYFLLAQADRPDPASPVAGPPPGPGPGYPPPAGFRERPGGPMDHPPRGPGGRMHAPGRGPMPPPLDRPFDGPPDARGGNDHLDAAILLLEELREEHPDVAKYRHLLARCYYAHAGGYLPIEEVYKRYDQAVTLLQKLVEGYPDVSDYRHDLAEAYAAFQVHGPSLAPEELPWAEERLERALAISEKLLAEHPSLPDYATSQVHIRLKLTQVLQRSAQPEAALECVRQALALQSSLVERFPKVSTYKIWQAIASDQVAQLLLDRGDLTEAETFLGNAVDILERLVEQDPTDRRAADLLAKCYDDLIFIRLPH